MLRGLIRHKKSPRAEPSRDRNLSPGVLDLQTGREGIHIPKTWLVAFFGPLAILAAACGSQTASSPPAKHEVKLSLHRLKDAATRTLPQTPTVAPPAVTLPLLKGSYPIPWQTKLSGSAPVSSCTFTAQKAFNVPLALPKAKAKLLSAFQTSKYKKSTTSSASGPTYHVTGVSYQSTSNPSLSVTFTFEAKGKSTNVGYWVTDVLKAKAGHHCASVSGSGASG